jgi:hypothetical protein
MSGTGVPLSTHRQKEDKDALMPGLTLEMKCATLVPKGGTFPADVPGLLRF